MHFQHVSQTNGIYLFLCSFIALGSQALDDIVAANLEWLKKRHRVKYGLDYFLDHILDHVLEHFFGPFYGGGGNTPLVLREGCDAVYHDSPYTSFRLLPLLNCFTIEQSTVKTSLRVN